jgi:TolA-binding protein
MSNTTTGLDRDELSGEAAAMAALARAELGHMTPTQRVRGLDRVSARIEGRARRLRTFGRLAVVGSFSVVAAVAVFALRSGRLAPATPPVAFQIEGGALGAAGAILSANGAAPTVRFVDGTAVKLAAGTLGRLTSVDDRGARFAIDRGTAEVSVTPRPGARWLFDAGPFLITVHGTVFTAAWDEADGRLDVRLQRGLVSVTGPVGGGPIAVREGQHLTVTLRQARVLLRGNDELELAPAAVAPPVAVPSPAPAPVPAPAPGERPAAPRAASIRPSPAARAAAARPPSTPTLTWAAALSAGDFEAIVRDASRDEAHALATRSSDDLAALASAARYRRRDDLARDALLAQRRRFPHSARAADAAFLLGRVEEAAGGLSFAVKWYDSYLEEAPSGAYASEALGRKMVVVQKLYGTVQARAVAEEYARRFPAGTYAGAARALRTAR